MPFRSTQLFWRFANIRASVVNQDVDVAKGLNRAGDHSVYRGFVADVHAQFQDLDAILCAQLRRLGSGLDLIKGRNDDVSPGTGKADRHPQPQATVTTSDNRYLIVQIKEIHEYSFAHRRRHTAVLSTGTSDASV